MASAPISDWLCEPCKEDEKHMKARTHCYECNELLCEPCSNYHLRLKSSKDHHLLELVQFRKKSTERHDSSPSKQTSTSVDEDELASDFLDHLTLTENTVLYRGAQVAVESETSKPMKFSTSKEVDPRRQTATKFLEFSMKRPEDQEDVWTTGLLCVSDTVVVVDNNNKVLKLFDQAGKHLISTELKAETWGLTCVRDSTFATCGDGNAVFLWTVHGQSIVSENVSYHVDYRADSIYHNGTYFCVLHGMNNVITVLDRQGREVRKIKIKKAFGKKIEFGYDIHMDSAANKIFVPCYKEDGVLCMTVLGRALWFTPLSSPLGISEIRGTLCVVDCDNDGLHLITNEGEYVKKLLNKEDLGVGPRCVCYGKNDKLYVSYYFNPFMHESSSDRRDKISVYIVT